MGNGGFSLRSRRLLEALQDPRIELVDAEDMTIGRTCRPLLERVTASASRATALADRFAFEAAYPIGQPFGFHGLFNFAASCRPTRSRARATFADAIARSPQLAQLLRNCVALGQWDDLRCAFAAPCVSPDPSRAAGATLLAQSEEARRAARSRRPQRSLPLRQRPALQAMSWRRRRPAAASAGHDRARALATHRLGDLASASADYRAALAIAPDHPHAIHYLGVIDYQQGQPAKALPLLERAVMLLPGEPEFHNNLGLVLAALDRNVDAAAAHRQAIARKPDHAGAWNNLGLALHAQMDLRGAIDAFRKALVLAPDAVQTQWNLALALLADGQFEEGWRAYEARLAIPAFAPATVPLTPRWTGDDARGKTILLVTEQGLGTPSSSSASRSALPIAARQ